MREEVMMDRIPIKPVVLELVERNPYHNDEEFKVAYTDGGRTVFAYPVPGGGYAKVHTTRYMETWRVVRVHHQSRRHRKFVAFYRNERDRTALEREKAVAEQLEVFA